ncbi:recombinase family protein [Actinomadura darangshiensis]|uniref:Recombinase family protein n=1 Tax=Actinomadura darangshiensis TaxID=705336 RepID=A0A4R5BJD4_9ACTN|nr:recombinase family protein [Actinomadura darangshiensis]TDD85246.1 recombinase family protein [Actinomadura darangshiensis]
MSSIQPRLIAYARISDLSGKRRTLAGVLGVHAQHSACEAMAHDADAIVVKRYTDNDRSASRGEHRSGFEALLLDLHRGHTAEGEPVQGVVAVDVDRIYKTPAQWERFITAFCTVPGRVFLDWQGHHDLYAPDADETGLQDVSVVMGENSRRSDRTRRWYAAQAQRGVAHTGGRVFGYRPAAGVAGAIEVVPEEAAVIREAVAACAEGRSWGAVTEIFARSGIPTENGGPWRTQTVKQIISSPRLAGLRMIDGEIVTDRLGEPERPCSGSGRLSLKRSSGI